jgi:hypothetical protein
MLLPWLYIALVALQAPASPQDIWLGVGEHPTLLKAGGSPITIAEKSAIRAVLRKQDRVWECAFDDAHGEWVQGLGFQRIPVSKDGGAFLVEAGAGCARGGQGSNGAMWIVQVRDGHTAVLASPAAGFNGWLYSVQPSSGKGYKDVVVGWHMSASEAGLNYFRFDGTQYKSLGSATIRWDDSQSAIITPERKRPR